MEPVREAWTEIGVRIRYVQFVQYETHCAILRYEFLGGKMPFSILGPGKNRIVHFETRPVSYRTAPWDTQANVAS